MQFISDASIYNAGGEEIGRLDRVVLDPRTGEVTHIVLRKGFFFTEDRVIPVDMIASAREREIKLREDLENLEELPVFEETHFVRADEPDASPAQGSHYDSTPPYAPPTLYWYPPATIPVGFPAYYRAPYPVETERNIPEGTIALKDGANVFSADGKQIGNIERIFTGENTQVNHFVISQGLFLKERKLIPANWITSVREDEVHLAVHADFLEKLPEYEETREK